MLGATRFLHQQGRLCFEKAYDSQTRPDSIYVGCVFCSSCIVAFLLPSHTFLRVGLPAAGLLSDIGGQQGGGGGGEGLRSRATGFWMERSIRHWWGGAHRLHTAGRRGGGDPAASGGGAVAAVAS